MGTYGNYGTGVIIITRVIIMMLRIEVIEVRVHANTTIHPSPPSLTHTHTHHVQRMVHDLETMYPCHPRDPGTVKRLQHERLLKACKCEADRYTHMRHHLPARVNK